jgi:hypothetical protein
MSTYKKEREINHKGAEGAQRRLKTKKSGTLCSFVRSNRRFVGGLYSSSRLFSLVRPFGLDCLLVP